MTRAVRRAAIAFVALAMASTAFAQGRESYGLVTSIQFLENGGDHPVSLSKIQELGTGSVRVEVYWSDVQPSPGGGFNFGFARQMVNNARASGIQVYLGLLHPPSWAAPCTDCLPYNMNDWYWFVRAAIQEFGTDVTYGVWNEPNDRKFLRTNPSDDSGEADTSWYSALVHSALAARNDLGSPARFALGEFTAAGWYNGWFQAFWIYTSAYSGVQPQDLISIHWYPSAGDGNLYDLLGGVIGYTGRELWLTETGTVTPTSDSAQVNEVQYIVSAFQNRPGNLAGWTRFFYYRLWDGSNNTEALLYGNWTNRPGFNTYKSLIPSGGGGSGPTILQGGFILYPERSVSSPNGRFVLKYQDDGNLVLYDNGAAVWAINCWPDCNATGFNGNAFAPAGYVTMQTDGNFVAYNSSGGPPWHTWTFGNPGAYLAIGDDGSLIVYGPSGNVLWSR